MMSIYAALWMATRVYSMLNNPHTAHRIAVYYYILASIGHTSVCASIFYSAANILTIYLVLTMPPPFGCSQGLFGTKGDTQRDDHQFDLFNEYAIR